MPGPNECSRHPVECYSGALAPQPPKPSPPSPLPPLGTPLAIAVNKISPVKTTNFGANSFPVDNTTVSVQLDIFVDGLVVEVFVNNGEHAITQLQPGAKTFTTSLSVDTRDGDSNKKTSTRQGAHVSQSATFSVSAWAMQPSITGN